MDLHLDDDGSFGMDPTNGTYLKRAYRKLTKCLVCSGKQNHMLNTFDSSNTWIGKKDSPGSQAYVLYVGSNRVHPKK